MGEGGVRGTQEGQPEYKKRIEEERRTALRRSQHTLRRPTETHSEASVVIVNRGGLERLLIVLISFMVACVVISAAGAMPGHARQEA